MVPDKLITSYILCGGKNIENVLVFVVMKKHALVQKKYIWSLLPLIPKIFSVWTSLAARLELWTSFGHPLIPQNFPCGAVKKGTHQTDGEYPSPRG